MKNFTIFFIVLFSISIVSCNHSPRKTQNQVSFSDSSKNEMNKITSKVFQVEQGWGYDIYINDKKFIHQETIPGVNGRFYFKTPEDARKTARAVVNLMLIREGMPGISYEHLDSLGVLYPEVVEFRDSLFSTYPDE